LYPRVGFVVTNLTRPAQWASKFYDGRGTAEQWIREGVPRALFAAILRRIDRTRTARIGPRAGARRPIWLEISRRTCSLSC
jgi:hypothetical protein